jgi:voltage-gated potassium channel
MAFLFSIPIAVTFLGALMYVVEGEKAGFTSIPRSIYWTIVTLSTVGYGDIAPQTGFGQFVAATVMILSYSMWLCLLGSLRYNYRLCNVGKIKICSDELPKSCLGGYITVTNS